MPTPRRRSPRTTAGPGRPSLRVERALIREGHVRLAAIDEVGRGAVAGPVTVGVVVVTAETTRAPDGVRDSKLLSAAGRTRLVGPIQRWAHAWAVGHAQPEEIDRFGIMQALGLAARRALAGLPEPADAVLLDGNIDYLTGGRQGALFDVDGRRASHAGRELVSAGLPVVHTRVKADRDCASVAAASILAKTTRDAMMIDYDRIYPVYGWADNKGYGTADHRAAIAAGGPCELHRRTWRLPTVEASPTVTATVGDDGTRAGAVGGAPGSMPTSVRGA